MWYGCLTKQLGGKVVYHCTFFGWVSNMICTDAIVPWLLCSIYNLALSHCQVRGTVPLSLFTIRGWIVSPYNLGPSCLSPQVWYGCLSKQFGGIYVYHWNLEVLYGVLWYWWYVPWLVSKILLSLCKSGLGVHCLSTQFGGLIVYPYNLGPSCLSTIHTQFRIPKKIVPADLLFPGMW